MLVSECCGAPVRGNSDDMGLCTECRDHCEYIDDEEELEALPLGENNTKPDLETTIAILENVGYYHCQQILMDKWKMSPVASKKLADSALAISNHRFQKI